VGYLKIHHYPEDPVLQKTVVTVGTFDGVHLGHKSILDRLKEIALKKGGETVLATFEPHPRTVLGKGSDNLKLLNTPEEKEELLSRAGIGHMVILPFTMEFSRQDEHTFIRKYLVDYLHVSQLVIGYNHRFGHRRNGNFTSLQDYGNKYGFEVEEMPKKDVGEVAVSSTQIRDLLNIGDVTGANRMLGYHYPLSGCVVSGKKIGRTLGFPTANMKIIYPKKLIPSQGVYAVVVDFEKKLYRGLCNIGTQPTFEGKSEVVEVNILDFEGDLYNKTLKIRFVERLREERKFDSKEALTAQIDADRRQAVALLREI